MGRAAWIRPGWLAAAAIALAVPAHAATISGAFVEKGAGTPLAGVAVVLYRAADSTVVARAVSDAAGRFRIDSLRAGAYLLRATLLGHQPLVRRDVQLRRDDSAYDLGTQPLTVTPIALPGVETKTARGTAIVTADRNVYLTKDLPMASTGTTIDLLRAVPEVDVDIDDKVSLRGSSGVTIQINGRTSPLRGDALTSFLRQYPASRIERVEVIANPSAKYDPEGTGGIINLVTREPLDLGLSGSVTLGAGTRSSGPGARIAWQEGKLTLYGGASGFWNHLEYQYADLRSVFFFPPSSYRLATDNVQRNGYGNLDGSFELAFDQRSTLYASSNGFLTSGRVNGLHDAEVADSASAITSSYDRVSEVSSDGRSGSATLGFQHVVERNRREWTVELRQNGWTGGSSSNAIEHVFVPADSSGTNSVLDEHDGSRERSAQLDDILPLGAAGKLESGYRAVERRNDSSMLLSVLSGGAGGGASAYAYHEVFHSAYLTAGSTFGRLSAQGGLRGEIASTHFDAQSTGREYDHEYRSLFPSANVAWDFGRGRTLRLTTSRRIDRPGADYLNPDVPSLDPLSRFVGNPALTPKYTNSVSLDASWSGSRGLLRLSPFWRETTRNWDQFRTVDSLGVSVTTWRNASAVRFLGGSLIASLRQTGRIGGTVNLSVYREQHDASNLSLLAVRDATNWSLNTNATFRVAAPLDLQGWAVYRPAQTLAQGRTSATLYSSLNARLKFGEKAWLSVSVNDPFGLWKYDYLQSDVGYRIVSSTHGTIRRAGATFGWSWGKPPEPKARKSSEESPPQEQPPQIH